MRFKRISIVLGAFFLCGLCQITALAQGGWDVWTIYLRDGTRIDAAPVWSLDKEFLKYGMSGEVGEGQKLKRSLINSMSRNVTAARSDPSRPKAPEGDVTKDLVVLADGTQVSGAVLIQARKKPDGQIQHFAPVLLQNDNETDLRKVEHIKLANPKRSP
jgi:hypothetical protein